MRSKTSYILFCCIWVAVVCLPSLGAASQRQFQLSVGRANFNIVVEPGRLQLTRDEICAYVRDAARAVIAYYGSFPVEQTLVRVSPSGEGGVGFATSTYDDEEDYGLVEIDLGYGTTRGDLERSWTMTHEMMHLAFPIMGHKHKWLAEGISTYIEPIGRMRIGKITREELWGDLAENIHKGLPSTNSSGLNGVTSFGRVYWGGALYCLLADIEIRKQTNNRIGLEHALRAIAKRGGTAASDWTAMQALETGDEAIGVEVLEDLYQQMAVKPKWIDIPRLLNELGIKQTGRRTYLTNQAPLAHVRQSIEGTAKRDLPN